MDEKLMSARRSSRRCVPVDHFQSGTIISKKQKIKHHKKKDPVEKKTFSLLDDDQFVNNEKKPLPVRKNKLEWAFGQKESKGEKRTIRQIHQAEQEQATEEQALDVETDEKHRRYYRKYIKNNDGLPAGRKSINIFTNVQPIKTNDSEYTFDVTEEEAAEYGNAKKSNFVCYDVPATLNFFLDKQVTQAGEDYIVADLSKTRRKAHLCRRFCLYLIAVNGDRLKTIAIDLSRKQNLDRPTSALRMMEVTEICDGSKLMYKQFFDRDDQIRKLDTAIERRQYILNLMGSL